MYWSSSVNRLAVDPAQGAGGAGKDRAVGGHAHQGGHLLHPATAFLVEAAQPFRLVILPGAGPTTGEGFGGEGADVF